MEYLIVFLVTSACLAGVVVGIAISNSRWASCALSDKRFYWNGSVYRVILEEDCEDEP